MLCPAELRAEARESLAPGTDLFPEGHGVGKAGGGLPRRNARFAEGLRAFLEKRPPKWK
jgi:enoyl-CoA hydratase/carnithine racemase